MFEKSEIQEQFPINEKKLWWYYGIYHFANIVCWEVFLIVNFRRDFYRKNEHGVWQFFGDFNVHNFEYIALILVFVLVFFFFILGDYKSLIKKINSFYFDVTHEGLIRSYKQGWLDLKYKKEILFEDIKCVTVSRAFFISDIYQVKLTSNRFFSFWYSVSIAGFDHDTAVAFKEFLDERIEQAKLGKNN